MIEKKILHAVHSNPFTDAFGTAAVRLTPRKKRRTERSKSTVTCDRRGASQRAVFPRRKERDVNNKGQRKKQRSPIIYVGNKENKRSLQEAVRGGSGTPKEP